MVDAVIEDLIYIGRESKQTVEESATWSNNGSIVDGHKTAFVKRLGDDVAKRFWC